MKDVTKAIVACRKSIKLHTRAGELLNELISGLQAESLCTYGRAKRFYLRSGTRIDKKAVIVIHNKDDDEFTYPLEECPHELRAHLLTTQGSHVFTSSSSLAYCRKQGWLTPHPKEGEATDATCSNTRT